MKTQVARFFGIVLALLLIAPIVNLWIVATRGDQPGRAIAEILLDDRRALYQFDPLLSWLALRAYAYGVSIDPGRVVIGYQGWLYLGDSYEQTLSRNRQPASADDAAAAARVDQATRVWRDWFGERGVKLFRIQLVPDKTSTYAEFLPHWAQSVAGNTTDKLRERLSDAIYVDQRSAMVAARAAYAQPLYYRTDTHWNSLGAWVGYRDLAQAVAASAGSGIDGEIRWLAPEQVRVGEPLPRTGGDLADFLGMGALLEDTEVPVEIDIGRPLPIEQVDFETGEATNLSHNPRLGSPARPVLLRSQNALNQCRVLWLRDSFGTAMSPFMAATFSDLMQLQYLSAEAPALEELVRAFKPDVVIVTVVERMSLADWFQRPPSAVSGVHGG